MKNTITSAKFTRFSGQSKELANLKVEQLESSRLMRIEKKVKKSEQSPTDL